MIGKLEVIEICVSYRVAADGAHLIGVIKLVAFR